MMHVHEDDARAQAQTKYLKSKPIGAFTAWPRTGPSGGPPCKRPRKHGNQQEHGKGLEHHKEHGKGMASMQYYHQS